MSSRKKSTSSDESSSGSSSESTSSSGSSSDSGSTSSGSESTSSSAEKVARSNSRSKEPPATNSGTTNTASNGTVTNSKNTVPPVNKNTRRRSSETKNQLKSDDKTNHNSSKNKPPVNRGQRLSKSSIYSSDEDISPAKKTTNKPPLAGDRKKVTDVRKSISSTTPQSIPPSGGGKAPPSVVKQQQQQNLAKNAAAKTAPSILSQLRQKEATAACNARTNLNKIPPKPQQSQQSSKTSKKKSIFSPDNSSNSDEDDKKSPSKPPPPAVSKSKPPPKSKLKPVPQKKPIPVKKENSKSTDSSATSSSSDDTTSSSDSDDSDSTEDSSPPSKRIQSKKPQSKLSGKSDSGKTVVLSDSDNDQTKMPAMRKLTRSSSTRKSKHLTGKTTDSETDIEVDKRSISKSPVKKAPINSTKSKTKTKREIKTTTPLPLATPPIPEEQKCPIEGCDSSGHLSGNLEKHFLPEACPIYHNMSVSESKERANERHLREEERKKAIALFDATKKIQTPEQKAYQMKIREARGKFKPLINTLTGEKIKTEKNIIPDKEREPNLIGLVPDYDLQLFREAQAIASEKMEKEIKDLPVGKGTKYITMGKHQMKVWYQSPYPEDAARQPKMYICEFCLRYQKSDVGMKRHAAKCVWRHPPGDEIYRKGKLQVWQVDGKRHKQYCQHLCLLAKFFLDHKTLYYDVEPFLFYVMTLVDSDGCHTVGYFSKEKNSFLNYNVSCILTLPPYQRKGYGRLLIDFSYLLTRVEGKIGSPEKPLSDLGLISYRSYWKDVLLDYLCTRTGTTLSIKDVSQEMAIYSYDIVSTLQALGMMKYWKGKHIILKKQDVLEEFEERVKRRGNFPTIDQACLRWNPFVPPQPSGST